MRTCRLLSLLLLAAFLATAAYATDYHRGDKGVFVGAVVDKTADSFTAKNETATEKFVPRWIGDPQTGGYDKNLLKQIKALKTGDRVKVTWIYEDRLTAVTITLLKPPPTSD